MGNTEIGNIWSIGKLRKLGMYGNGEDRKSRENKGGMENGE